VRTIEKRTGKVVIAETYGADGSRTFTFAESLASHTSDNPWDIAAAEIRKKGEVQ
jgi:hypothetical protein